MMDDNFDTLFYFDCYTTYVLIILSVIIFQQWIVRTLLLPTYSTSVERNVFLRELQNMDSACIYMYIWDRGSLVTKDGKVNARRRENLAHINAVFPDPAVVRPPSWVART